jgi:hypothetical protein
LKKWKKLRTQRQNQSNKKFMRFHLMVFFSGVDVLSLLLIICQFQCSCSLCDMLPFSVIIPQQSKRPLDDFTHRSISDMRECMRGKTAIVTGANSGIGFETVRMLAGHARATTILACRNATAAASAAARIRSEFSDAAVECMPLDLEDLGSIDRFAAALSGRPVHVLIHNAGIMAAPGRPTVDGFEPTFQARAVA